MTNHEKKLKIIEEMGKMSKEEILEELREMASNGEMEVEEEDTELFEGSGQWYKIVSDFWVHPFTWKILFVSMAAMTAIHFGATFALALERDSIYQTTGNSVKFNYQKHLMTLPGYDVVLHRREFHNEGKEITETVREERNRELELKEFQLKREEYEKQTLRLSELPPAPGADVLGELGMRDKKDLGH